MKITKKQLLSLLLALTLLFTAMPAVFAAQPEDALERQYENGYEFSVMQTEDGPVLTEVYYYGRENDSSDVAFLPETLGGLPVTPDVIDGTTFWYGYDWKAVKVSANNPWFKTVNGALYSKDGKILIYMPNPYGDPILTVPDGVEVIGEAALWNTGCAILPDSVTEIKDEYGRLSYLVIAANTGTPAEAIAREHGCKFVPLNADHSHVYFYGTVTQQATCANSGTVELVCPCGAVLPTDIPQRDHRFYGSYDFETESWEYRCEYCGRTFEEIFSEYIEPDDPDAPSRSECTCVCHRIGNTTPGGSTAGTAVSILRDFLYRLRIVFWRIAGTHQYCECGERHY